MVVDVDGLLVLVLVAGCEVEAVLEAVVDGAGGAVHTMGGKNPPRCGWDAVASRERRDGAGRNNAVFSGCKAGAAIQMNRPLGASARLAL